MHMKPWKLFSHPGHYASLWFFFILFLEENNIFAFTVIYLNKLFIEDLKLYWWAKSSSCVRFWQLKIVIAPVLIIYSDTKEFHFFFNLMIKNFQTSVERYHYPTLKTGLKESSQIHLSVPDLGMFWRYWMDLKF